MPCPQSWPDDLLISPLLVPNSRERRPEGSCGWGPLGDTRGLGTSAEARQDAAFSTPSSSLLHLMTICCTDNPRDPRIYPFRPPTSSQPAFWLPELHTVFRALPRLSASEYDLRVLGKCQEYLQKSYIMKYAKIDTGCNGSRSIVPADARDLMRVKNKMRSSHVVVCFVRPMGSPITSWLKPLAHHVVRVPS